MESTRAESSPNKIWLWVNCGKEVGVVDEMDVKMGVDVGGQMLVDMYLIPVFHNHSLKFT